MSIETIPPNRISRTIEHIAEEVAENEFTVVQVTPLDEDGNPIQDDAVIFDPHEIGIHGALPENE